MQPLLISNHTLLHMAYKKFSINPQNSPQQCLLHVNVVAKNFNVNFLLTELGM